MNPHFPHLFQSLAIGPRTSRNRVMRLATVTNTGANGLATERTIAHYERLARGGTGVIVTEAMRVHQSNIGRDAAMILFRKEIIPSLQRLTDAVHQAGSLLVAQINHNGRQHHSSEVPTLWAPSAIACPHSGGTPHEMTRSEIAEVVAGFAMATRHARAAGCDGVEIHGAQGHLIQQFLSPFSNHREDDYGGSLENRMRFSNEVIDAVRAEAGDDFIVGYRMGVEEFTPGGITVEDSIVIAQRLAASHPVDYLSLAQGNFNTIDFHLPDAHYPPATFAAMHGRIKSAVPHVVVIASSKIQTPEQAETILAAGQADMIGMSRALIADASWPAKAARGAVSDIRRCVSCNRCWGAVVGQRRIVCAVNAAAGSELDFPAIVRAARPRKVVVVGGGPGGMEAARVAALRGHDVTLIEKGGVLGGKMAHAEAYADFHDIAHAVTYLRAQVQRLGVRIELNRKVEASDVLNAGADAVVVATGARIVTPEIPGDGSLPVRSFAGSDAGARVVVMDEDGYFWGACLTESLARKGYKVTYVTRFLEPLRELPEVSRISTLRSLDRLGVELRPTMFVERIENGSVYLRHYYNHDREERVDEVQEVIWAGMQQVDTSVVEGLRVAGHPDVHVIGDAYAPRRMANAISEGYRIGRTL